MIYNMSKRTDNMKKRIFNLIILDESGSMGCIEKQAIDGVNETIQAIVEAQKTHTDQEHFLTLVSFNSARITTIYDKVAADKIEELTPKQYNPACCTPLFDAMGGSITALQSFVADNDTVLVTIITDGYENASKEYNGEAIKALVEAKKTKGWIFTYIGANQDVEMVASRMSINNSMSFCSDESGTKKMFSKDRMARHRLYGKIARNETFEDLSKGYFDE